MEIKFLIFGEGPTDYGTDDGFGTWLPGPIMPILCSVLPEHNIVFEAIRKRDLEDVKRGKRAFQGSGLTGHGKNIIKIMQYILFHEKEYDYLIYYGDTDKDSSEKANEQTARKASEAAYSEASQAFDYVREEMGHESKGIAVIPLRMIESWLLADELALENVLGCSIDKKLKPRKPPEFLWGDKHNPNSDYPKHVLERILESAGLSPNRETFLEIATAINPQTLHENCPISFQPLLDQLEQFDLVNTSPYSYRKPF